MTTLLLGQLLDEGNHNAQVSNAANIVTRSPDDGVRWLVPYYTAPDRRLVGRPSVGLRRLVRGSLWRLHKSLFYQSPADVIFYPGPYWFDALGLGLRRLSGREVPVVATLEGLVGGPQRERQLSAWAGHRVNCQRAAPTVLRHVDTLYRRARHIIAISPFLADMARRLYGDKVSVLPLGVENTVFHPGDGHAPPRPRVLGAGRLYANKRPGVFVDLARRFPGADFIWFGDGELLPELRQRATALPNLSFPGPVDRRRLAEAMRSASLFVLPSLAEGVPKVTQEAAACGLPVVLFGYYEAPSVVDGENGFVVWDDDALAERVGHLLDNPAAAAVMGRRGAAMAAEWSWDRAAPRWRDEVIMAAGR